ncbi:hypothetical protein ACFWF9_03915 [Streptomyces roseolus]|uniref:hypothetical protein n=1 Tax=Streptomyces roseolus TaxID=67358 RepID=UPI003661076C
MAEPRERQRTAGIRVARAGLGSGIAPSAYAARHAAREPYGEGGYAPSPRRALDHAEVDGLFDTSG